MPSCIVNKCHNKSGRKGQNPNIILHTFPRDVERVVLWLSQTGQTFDDIQAVAQQISEGNKSNKYVICSEHFAPDSYRVCHYGKVLNRDAIPTIFPAAMAGESIIEESLKKPTSHSRKRVRKADLPTNLLEKIQSPCESIEYEIVKPGMFSVATQTEFNMTNCIMHFATKSETVSEVSEETKASSAGPITSTPLHVGGRNVSLTGPDVSSPEKKPKIEPKTEIKTEPWFSHSS